MCINTLLLPPPPCTPRFLSSASSQAPAPAALPPAPIRSCKVFSGAKYPESDITAVAAMDTPGGSLTVALGLGSGCIYTLTTDLGGEGERWLNGWGC